MLRLILTTYFYTLLSTFSTTVLLLMTGFGWGSLPHKYLKAVLYFQSFFEKGEILYEKIIERNTESLIYQQLFSNPSINSFDTKMERVELMNTPRKNGVFETNLEFITSGIESIIQDDVSAMFTLASAYNSAEPRSISEILRPKMALKNTKLTSKLKNLMLYTSSLFLRFAFLCPIRLALIISSFAFISICCILACFISFSARSKTRIAVIYCRLYTAGTGLVARYHNGDKNRPVRPGVAVANHLSPNDIQIISADVPYDNPSRDYLYTVTGQKHKGIIWAIERLVEKLCPSIWLERARPEERKKFTKAIIDTARVCRGCGPILLFPEGYCTNNNKVLQFRRAIFEATINIYPISFRQDARFGDSFWGEDHFFNYLIRLLSSWAVVYDVIYLPVEHRKPNESSVEFAARVQCKIAKAAKLPIAKFDGGLYYKRGDAATERRRHRNELQAKLASKLLESDVLRDNSNNNNNSDTPKNGNYSKESQNGGNSTPYYRSLSYNSADLLL